MTHETAETIAPVVPEQLGGEPEPAPVPRQPTVQAGSTQAGSMRTVPFDRLLAVATLTPGQALLVAARLLRAVAASGTAAAAGTAGCRLGPVSFTPSGDIDVAVASAGEDTPVTELLQSLLGNARRLPAHPKPEQHLLLHRLEEVAAGPASDADTRADGLEEALAASLGVGARQRLSAQLAALVEAATHIVPAVPSPAEGGPLEAAVGPPTRRGRTPSLVPAGPTRAGRRRTHVSSRTRLRSAALVVAVLVAALAATAYVGLLRPGAGIVDSLGRGDPPAAPATKAPGRPAHQPAKHARKHQSREVPTLARRHAGPVAGVQLLRSGSCNPGSLCPVKVTVHLRTASAGSPVRWKVGAARLCKRGMVWSSPVSVTPQPGWRTVYASSSVRVPKGPSALLVLTTAPARVQSPPVPVTGSSRHC
jgi:hypothetical protein